MIGAESTVERPMLRYHGGKWMLAPWIVSHFPPHRIYVSAYGGAASELLRKPRSYSEVYNDLDGEIVNLFRVVQARGYDLAAALEVTPFSREEYRLSFEVHTDPFEQARRTVIRSYMGFGSNSLCRSVKSGFRSNSNRSGTTPARDWKNFPGCLPAIIERLRGVVIENMPACELMPRHDSEQTLFYCDPPYVHSTRTTWAGSGARKGYQHEMTDEDHVAFAACVKSLRGMVIISGYHSPLYDSLFADWRRVERDSMADGARARKEVLWFNFQSLDLFSK
jgi:DNA adenine methylase